MVMCKGAHTAFSKTFIIWNRVSGQTYRGQKVTVANGMEQPTVPGEAQSRRKCNCFGETICSRKICFLIGRSSEGQPQGHRAARHGCHDPQAKWC